MGKNSKGGTANMKKLLILISIIMLLFSVTGTAEAVMQEDVKALESLIDIMSGKIADYGEVIGDTEDNLKAVNKDVEALEKKIQGLNAADRFLWTKIEAQSPEALIESRVSALEEQMEDYVAQLKGEIAQVAEKAEDQTAIKKLENRIKALTDNMELFIAEEEEQQKLVASIEDQTAKKLESLSKTLAELETYAKNMEQEFQDALSALSENMKPADENLTGNEDLEALEKALNDAKIALNTRAKWMDISIKTVKEDLASMAAELAQETVLLRENLDRYKASTNQRLKWIDLTVAKNKERVEAVKTDLKAVQDDFDSQLEDSLWGINQRLKWVDINTGNLRASMNTLNDKVEGNRVYVDNLVSELETTVQNNQLATNQRMKWTDISISNLKSDVQDNKEIIQNILNDMEALEASGQETEEVVNSSFEETIANLNQRLKWMDIASSNTKEQVAALEELVKSTEGELKAELQSAIAGLNTRLKWMDIASTNLREKVEKQSEQITALEKELKAELSDKIYFLNQRLKWMDIQINKVKSESASQEDMLALKDEFDYNVSRLNNLAFEVAYSKGITEDVLDKISEIDEQIAMLSNNFNMILSEYVTKDILEEEIANIQAELDEVELLTLDLTEENQAAIENAVWSINQRLKWIDITIRKAKDERGELAQYTKEIEERLQNEINSKVLFINKRLKWMDISITNLKETKVDEAEYTKTVTKLDVDKVDKETFAEELEGISTRFDALETELGAFKTDTMDLMAAQKKALEAKIGNNTVLIQDNAEAIKDNNKEIEALEKRIEMLESQVFPEEKQPAAFGVLLGFGLVIGLGFVISSIAK
jgi:chromosome segregation ATPase